MSDKFILNESGEPVPCDDLLTWARWYEGANAQRQVALAEIAPGVQVSTVFRGLALVRDQAPPMLWETDVFGGPTDGDGGRYHTRAEAVAGHEAVCARARAALEG